MCCSPWFYTNRGKIGVLRVLNFFPVWLPKLCLLFFYVNFVILITQSMHIILWYLYFHNMKKIKNFKQCIAILFSCGMDTTTPYHHHQRVASQNATSKHLEIFQMDKYQLYYCICIIMFKCFYICDLKQSFGYLHRRTVISLPNDTVSF